MISRWTATSRVLRHQEELNRLEQQLKYIDRGIRVSMAACIAGGMAVVVAFLMIFSVVPVRTATVTLVILLGMTIVLGIVSQLIADKG